MQPAPHDHETILEVEAPRVKFGRGAIDEVGAEAAALGLRRVALFTDAKLAAGAFVERARASLRAAGVDFAEFAAVRIEPTDGSFREAAALLDKLAGLQVGSETLRTDAERVGTDLEGRQRRAMADIAASQEPSPDNSQDATRAEPSRHPSFPMPNSR